MQEEEIEKLQKVEKHKKNKSKKAGKSYESDVTETTKEIEVDSGDVKTDAAAEEVIANSKKLEKKNKKTESVDKDDSMVINRKGPIKPENEKRAAGLESRNNEKKNKKRKKKETSDKHDTISSFPESPLCRKNKEVDEEIIDSHCKKHTGSKERVDDAKKERNKEKRKGSVVLKSPLPEASDRGSVGESTLIVENIESSDKKKKQEREDNFLVAEKDDINTLEKVKQASSTKYKETTKDGAGLIPSNLATSDKKRKRKKEKRDGAAEGEESSPEGISKKGMIAGKKITAEADEAVKDKVEEETSRKDGSTNDSDTSRSKKKSRRVSFSGNVEVFPPTNNTDEEEHDEKGLVQGKRFSLEEDELVKEAVLKYIEAHQLGEEGLHMVLHCRSYPQVKNCWKQIGTSLPWRPYISVYYRAHILFERSENRKWEPEEYNIIRSFQEKHGSNWKTLAGILGKHRVHVKDTWRRIILQNRRKGHWSQEEYQSLFDLVNLDLKMRAFEEKKTKYGMLRDNIAWGAISQKLSTRPMASCCVKWYQQLSSPLVSQGLWVDSDDYRMLDALQQLDACCIEDVDWDNLLEHRSGEICRKRWQQMTRHIGEYREKPFTEQLDVLSQRYNPEMLEYKK